MALSPQQFIFESIVLFFPAIIVCVCAAALVILLLSLALPLYIMGGFRKILVTKFATMLADNYWSLLVSFIEEWGRFQFVITGEKIPAHETSIVISNHRWYPDWLMIFSLAKRKGRLGVCKFFAKNTVRYVPGIGWGLVILDSIFLTRNWTDDADKILKTFSSLKESKLPFWIISHLEGTRFAPKKLAQSQEFAKKHDLPILNNILLPRHKGFNATVFALRDTVNSVIDITLIYEDGKRYPSLSRAVLRLGGKVNMHVRRYPISTLPIKEEDLNKWLLDRWKEKDELIQYFNEHGKFPGPVLDEPHVRVPINLP